MVQKNIEMDQHDTFVKRLGMSCPLLCKYGKIFYEFTDLTVK